MRHLMSILLAVILASSAEAATFFYQHTGADAYRPGYALLLTESDGQFTGALYGDRQSVDVLFIPHFGSTSAGIQVTFGPAQGHPLVPGTYESTIPYPNPDRPFLSIDSTQGDCGFAPGSFVLHELVADEAGDIITLALDFEQECGSGTTVGALRIGTGDDECGDAADGDPCDDRDPCTRNDACRAGVCEGVDSVSATCSSSDACTEGGTCDRRSGVCRAFERQNGTACDDGDNCTLTATCRDGQCIGSDAPDCDDQSFCSDDRCVPAIGCVHDSVPGVCLVARPVVSTVATASAGGQSARCTLRCQSPSILTLILYDNGTYLSPGGTVPDCPTGRAVIFPDEVGKVRVSSRKVARLVPTNAMELLDATAACAGVRPREYRTRIFGDRDGPPQGITNITRFLVRDRVPVSVTSRVHGRFVPGIGPFGAVVPPETNSALPLCDESLRPRCVRD